RRVGGGKNPSTTSSSPVNSTPTATTACPPPRSPSGSTTVSPSPPRTQSPYQRSTWTACSCENIRSSTTAGRATTPCVSSTSPTTCTRFVTDRGRGACRSQAPKPVPRRYAERVRSANADSPDHPAHEPPEPHEVPPS